MQSHISYAMKVYGTVGQSCRYYFPAAHTSHVHETNHFQIMVKCEFMS